MHIQYPGVEVTQHPVSYEMDMTVWVFVSWKEGL